MVPSSVEASSRTVGAFHTPNALSSEIGGLATACAVHCSLTAPTRAPGSALRRRAGPGKFVATLRNRPSKPEALALQTPSARSDDCIQMNGIRLARVMGCLMEARFTSVVMSNWAGSFHGERDADPRSRRRIQRCSSSLPSNASVQRTTPFELRMHKTKTIFSLEDIYIPRKMALGKTENFGGVCQNWRSRLGSGIAMEWMCLDDRMYFAARERGFRSLDSSPTHDECPAHNHPSSPEWSGRRA